MKHYTYVTTSIAAGEDTTPAIPCEGKKFIGFAIGSVALTGTYLSGNISLADTGDLIPAYISKGSVEDPILAATKLDGADTFYKVFDSEVYSGVKRISLTSQAEQVDNPCAITLVFEMET